MNPIKKLATTEKPTETGLYLWWHRRESLLPSSELAYLFYDGTVLKVRFSSMDHPPYYNISNAGIADRLWLKVSD